MHSLNIMRKKILISLFVLALVSVFIIFIAINKNSTINIYTVPNDATISVDNKDLGKGHVTLSVTNGKHQIRAIKDGYNAYSESLQVSKNTSQTIILTPTQTAPSQVGTVSITPYAATSFQPVSSDTLIAIDSNNSNLIKIGKDGTTTLYAKPVYAFSFVNPYVALIEKGNRDKIAIVNIEDGSVKNFDAKGVAPVISISMGGDIKNFYFLGNYNPATRNSSLYISSLDGFSPKNEGVYTADNVSALTGNKILLTATADAADSTNFSVYDVLNKKYLYNTNGAGALVSPSYKNLAVYSSDSLRIVSLGDFSEKSYDYSFTNQKVVWADADTLIVLTNEFPGVKFYKIDTLSNSQTSNTEVTKFNQVSVRFTIGVIEKNLYLQDSEGKVWLFNLP